ncbi:predicted protein [Naegleria gruberi]|uniref:Predicted protein n=1 Tax=Naegleria gruberi TaxID=5762 RepID=D2VFJ0_NAEGR|nr:uncharacterized protein NAEGRDRAFT_49121 [Naegleria gruberi]EFC44475.1 predicted protein [Naegleria gruberi]|eukprot:XP_002677219.1 predicted protein [Naegleria gruberi strain NEG-M]
MRTSRLLLNATFNTIIESKEARRKERLLEIYSIYNSLSPEEKVKKAFSGEMWLGATNIFKDEQPLANIYHLGYLDSLSTSIVPQLSKNHAIWANYRLSNTHHSTSIEGNTLSQKDCEILFDSFGTYSSEQLMGVSQQDFSQILQKEATTRECLEVLFHHHAFQYISKLEEQPLSHFNENQLLNIHTELFGKSKCYCNVEGFMESNYRLIPIRVKGSETVRPYPQEVPQIMKQYFEWFHLNRERVDNGILHPALFSILAHCKFLHIHPFLDGNGRTARLLMNMILNRYGLFDITVQKKCRTKYLELLEEHQNGLTEPFHNFMVQQIIQTIKTVSKHAIVY